VKKREWYVRVSLYLPIVVLSIKVLLHHHHKPINVPTAGAQTFLMDYT
jgi:hypothetical protein